MQVMYVFTKGCNPGIPMHKQTKGKKPTRPEDQNELGKSTLNRKHDDKE